MRNGGVVVPGSLTSGSRSLTTTQLVLRAAKAATALAGLGVAPGDAVVLILRNDHAFAEATIATSILGASAVPINWHLRGNEVAYILEDCEARAIVVHADLLDGLHASIPADIPVVVVKTPPELARAYDIATVSCAVPPSRVDWDAWIEQYQPWPQPARQAPNTIMYTSGTTGRPKGVIRKPMPLDRLAQLVRQVSPILGLWPGVRTVITGPMYHAAPNNFAIFALRENGHVWLQPRFDPEQLLKWVERYRIESLPMVPIMFVRLLRLPESVRRKYDLSSLRHISHTAAPCPPEIKRGMIEWLGPIVHEYYGSTETGMSSHCNSAEWLENIGTVGRIAEGCDLKVLDEEGRQQPAGQPGTIYTKFPIYGDFTYKNLAEQRAEIAHGSFVTAGDVGYLNERGFLFLCDRSRDLVISGGVNIYPAEIESVLLEMPSIQDCAVFGIPDEEFGESLMAVIQPRPQVQIDEDVVRAYIGERLAGYKIPRVIEFREELPREDSGKIFKRVLRAPYWDKTGRSI